MKNILLKLNMVAIFIVVLFANISFAKVTEITIDTNAEKVRRQDGVIFTVPKAGRYSYSVYYVKDNKEIQIESATICKRDDTAVNMGARDENGEVIWDQLVLDKEDYIMKFSSTYTQYKIIIKLDYQSESYGTEQDDVNFGGIATDEDFEKATGVNRSNSDIPQADTAEKVFSIYFLDFGDYAQKFLRGIFGEDVTIDKIVYNKVSLLNANFFTNSTNAASNEASDIIRNSINKWFEYFKQLSLVVILVSIIAAGIRIMLQTPRAKAKAYDNIKRVVLAIALVYFFPYVMRYAFEINEAIIQYINQSNSYGVISAVPISPASDLEEEELEFRSPKYVSLEGKNSNTNSSENTEIYMNKLDEYIKNVDIMRMMRAFAGVTYRFVYVVLWYIMLAQVYILAFIYLKRYLTIAFLIIIYPLVVAGYVIDGVSGKRKGAFNTWCKKFFSTVFLQTIHAIMYGIISGILVNQVLKSTKNGMPGSQKINVILMIVATSFLFSGEKILTKFWKSSIDSSAERRGLRQAFGMPRRVIGNFKGK